LILSFNDEVTSICHFERRVGVIVFYKGLASALAQRTDVLSRA
jgi:hypothetical protein